MTLAVDWYMKTQRFDLINLLFLCIIELRFSEKSGVYGIKYAMFTVPKFHVHIHGRIKLEQSLSRIGRYVFKKCVLNQMFLFLKIVEILNQQTGILKVIL